MKYDVERLLDDLFLIIQSGLNDQITKIQTEKAILLGDDNFEVKVINDDAWFDALDDRVVNYDPYVYYGINDNSIIEIAGAESSEVTLFFTVVAHYDGDDKPMFRMMLRYIRALQEIITENFSVIREVSNLKVSVIQPQDLKDLDQDTFHKIGGISIQTSIS